MLCTEWCSEAWTSDVACQIKEALSGKIHDVLSPLSPAVCIEDTKNSFGQFQDGQGKEKV